MCNHGVRLEIRQEKGGEMDRLYAMALNSCWIILVLSYLRIFTALSMDSCGE